jgi:membrane protein implicated in regulation of membrane protease activity
MAHRPKTVLGNVLLFLLTLGIAAFAVWVVSLTGPLVWASLAVAAISSVAVYAWRRRVEAARERAWVGEFSFGDVVARMHAREALRTAGRSG